VSVTISMKLKMPFTHSCGLEQSSQYEINTLQTVAMVTVANDWEDDLFLGWVYESHTDRPRINSIIVAVMLHFLCCCRQRPYWTHKPLSNVQTDHMIK